MKKNNTKTRIKGKGKKTKSVIERVKILESNSKVDFVNFNKMIHAINELKKTMFKYEITIPIILDILYKKKITTKKKLDKLVKKRLEAINKVGKENEEKRKKDIKKDENKKEEVKDNVSSALSKTDGNKTV